MFRHIKAAWARSDGVNKGLMSEKEGWPVYSLIISAALDTVTFTRLLLAWSTVGWLTYALSFCSVHNNIFLSLEENINKSRL